MATVTKSAADSAVKLLSTVSVSADAISTIVGAAGAAFAVLDGKAQAWLQSSRKDIADATTTHAVTSASLAAQGLNSHFEELDKYLAGNAKRKTGYETALQMIMAGREAAEA